MYRLSISENLHFSHTKSLLTQRSSYRVTPSGFLRLPRPSSRPTSKVADTLQAEQQPLSLALSLIKQISIFGGRRWVGGGDFLLTGGFGV